MANYWIVTGTLTNGGRASSKRVYVESEATELGDIMHLDSLINKKLATHAQTKEAVFIAKTFRRINEGAFNSRNRSFDTTIKYP